MEGPERKKVPQFHVGEKRGGPVPCEEEISNTFISMVSEMSEETIDIYMILEQ